MLDLTTKHIIHTFGHFVGNFLERGTMGDILLWGELVEWDFQTNKSVGRFQS